MYFIFCILWVRSLCSNLSGVSLFSCGSRVVAWVFHSCSNCVMCNWKFASILLRWIPPSFFIGISVLVVGDLIQSWYLILCMSCAPPFFASICCVRPL